MSLAINKITKERAAAMGSEYAKLYKLAEQQLDEHKVWLFAQLMAMDCTAYEHTPTQWGALMDAVQHIRIAQLTIDKLGEDLVVRQLLDYPDELHALLMREDIPEHLRIGGVTITDEPTARRI